MRIWHYFPDVREVQSLSDRIARGVESKDGPMIAAAPDMHKLLKRSLDAMSPNCPLACDIRNLLLPIEANYE